MPQQEPYIYSLIFARVLVISMLHTVCFTWPVHTCAFNQTLHCFYLNSFLFWYTWQVHSHYSGTLEQFLGISRATRSHPLLKINRTCNPRNFLVSLAFTHVDMANLPAICIPLCGSRGQLAFGSGRFLE